MKDQLNGESNNRDKKKKLKWLPKALLWILAIVVCLGVVIVPKIYDRTIEIFKAKFELEYDTAGDIAMLSAAVQYRASLHALGLRREGYIQRAIAKGLSGYFDDIRSKVPDTDCEYYFADFLFNFAPYVTSPQEEDYLFLTKNVADTANKMYSSPCRSAPMEKFFKIYSYIGYLHFFEAHHRDIPLEQSEKLATLNSLIDNAFLLISRTSPQDYLTYIRIPIKEPSNYTLLMEIMFDAVVQKAELTQKGICDPETKQMLLSIQSKRKEALQFFSEKQILRKKYDAKDVEATNNFIKSTLESIQKCQ